MKVMKSKLLLSPFRKNESEGTIKYFSLAYPIIDALDNGKRLIIDEQQESSTTVYLLVEELNKFL